MGVPFESSRASRQLIRAFREVLIQRRKRKNRHKFSTKSAKPGAILTDFNKQLIRLSRNAASLRLMAPSMRLIPVQADPYIDLERDGKFGCRDHMLSEPRCRVLDGVVGDFQHELVMHLHDEPRGNP